MGFLRPSEFVKDTNVGDVDFLFVLFTHGFPKTRTRKGQIIIDEDKGKAWLVENAELVEEIREKLLEELCDSEDDEPEDESESEDESDESDESEDPSETEDESECESEDDSDDTSDEAD